MLGTTYRRIADMRARAITRMEQFHSAACGDDA
jgi:hypothetical protein